MRKVRVRISITKAPLLVVALIILINYTSVCLAASLQHFAGLKPTPFMVDFLGELLINENIAQIGDEIAVFNEQGLLCGACAVTRAGQYGILHVYGDDPTTHEVEGALLKQKLFFVVWDSKLDVEYPVSSAGMLSTSVGSFRPSPLPPVWTADKEHYGLSIKVVYQPQGNKKGSL